MCPKNHVSQITAGTTPGMTQEIGTSKFFVTTNIQINVTAVMRWQKLF